MDSKNVLPTEQIHVRNHSLSDQKDCHERSLGAHIRDFEGQIRSGIIKGKMRVKRPCWKFSVSLWNSELVSRGKCYFLWRRWQRIVQKTGKEQHPSLRVPKKKWFSCFSSSREGLILGLLICWLRLWLGYHGNVQMCKEELPFFFDPTRNASLSCFLTKVFSQKPSHLSRNIYSLLSSEAFSSSSCVKRPFLYSSPPFSVLSECFEDFRTGLFAKVGALLFSSVSGERVPQLFFGRVRDRTFMRVE